MHFSPSDADCCGNILADAVKSRHKPRASDICEESGETEVEEYIISGPQWFLFNAY